MCDPSSCFRVIFRMFYSVVECTESIPLLSSFLRKQTSGISDPSQTDGDTSMVSTTVSGATTLPGPQSLQPAGLPVSNIGGVCKRAMEKRERKISQSSDTIERPWDGVPNQEPHYFTFEVSWEVANKGTSYTRFLTVLFLLDKTGLGAFYIPPLTGCLIWSKNQSYIAPLAKSYRISCC